MRPRWIAVVCAVGAAAAVAWAGVDRPWPVRRNPAVETFHVTAHKQTPASLWPAEPPSPDPVDPQRFAAALHHLCSRVSRASVARLADVVREQAARFSVDPFLLGALIYDQSGCRRVPYKRYRERGLVGPCHLPVRMHAGHARHKVYRYAVRGDDGRWQWRALPLECPMRPGPAARTACNVHLCAAVLRVAAEQRDALAPLGDNGSVRHFVSHYFYGDYVRSPEPENRVLTARRRLVAAYLGTGPVRAGTAAGVPLVSPLDGVPRLVIDYFGNRRGRADGYGHRGIDIDGAIGEPVRAVADGVVVFAGVDLPGPGNHRLIQPEEHETIDPSSVPQGGGLYVMLRHAHGVLSTYMHLDSISVAYGAAVRAGDVIGTLGRSGARRSGPHLHLELWVDGHRVDPAAVLSDVLVNPFAPPPR